MNFEILFALFILASILAVFCYEIFFKKTDDVYPYYCTITNCNRTDGTITEDSADQTEDSADHNKSFYVDYEGDALYA